jgi:uncharacterized RmlC-like cupin family protein
MWRTVPAIDATGDRQEQWLRLIHKVEQRNFNRSTILEKLMSDQDHNHGDHAHDHTHDHEVRHSERWKHDGVRVIKGDQLDPNTAQTPGMFRQAAINHARVGAQKIWAGTVAIEPNAKTGVHHHGALESVIFVIRGKARMRWGDRLEYVAEAGPGDFIFVPPYVPHQEINADPDHALECVLVRSDNEAVVVNITDVDPVEKPEAVYWVDPIHRHPAG